MASGAPGVPLCDLTGPRWASDGSCHSDLLHPHTLAHKTLDPLRTSSPDFATCPPPHTPPPGPVPRPRGQQGWQDRLWAQGRGARQDFQGPLFLPRPTCGLSLPPREPGWETNIRVVVCFIAVSGTEPSISLIYACIEIFCSVF